MTTEIKKVKKSIEIFVEKLDFVRRLSLSNNDCKSIERIAKQYKKESDLDQSRIYGVSVLPTTNVYLAFEKNEKIVIGFAHLVQVITLASQHGRVEDVAVDEEYQGCGVGQMLMQHIIKDAKEMKLEFLELTSKPERQVANHLYEQLGFDIRETNVRRLKLKK